MQLRPPGGDLTWLTVLWFIAGTFLAARAGIIGDPVALFVGVAVASGAVLVWLDVKWVAKPLMIVFSLGIATGVSRLLAGAFSWRLVFRIGMSTYTLVALWNWARRPPVGSAITEQLLQVERSLTLWIPLQTPMGSLPSNFADRIQEKLANEGFDSTPHTRPDASGLQFRGVQLERTCRAIIPLLKRHCPPGTYFESAAEDPDAVAAVFPLFDPDEVPVQEPL